MATLSRGGKNTSRSYYRSQEPYLLLQLQIFDPSPGQVVRIPFTIQSHHKVQTRETRDKTRRLNPPLGYIRLSSRPFKNHQTIDIHPRAISRHIRREPYSFSGTTGSDSGRSNRIIGTDPGNHKVGTRIPKAGRTR